MIFVLHYILFSCGLPTVIILTALFLQTYSDTSMAEIGALLMALPFVSIIARPFFCALADRHQAHKLYLIGACFTMILGYGSLAIAPFFPDFIRDHGRLIWYFNMLGVIVGYSSFSVIFSLGDALALNAARKRGISWSLYRVWSTLSWGVGGYVIGQCNETPSLPKYVPGIFLLVCAMALEIVFVAVWDKKAFDMNDRPNETNHSESNKDLATVDRKAEHVFDNQIGDEKWSASPFGTMSGHNAKLVGALAGMVVEDIGASLRSSLRMGQPERTGLSEMLEQHGPDWMGLPQAALAKSDALSRQLSVQNPDKNNMDHPGSLVVQSLGPARGKRLSRGARVDPGSPPARRSILKQSQLEQTHSPVGEKQEHQMAAIGTATKPEAQGKVDIENKRSDVDDLQMLLLKFIVKRDRTIIKSLFSFTLFGFLMALHASYFFVHVEEVCRKEGYDFSKVMGAMCASQSVSEIFSFLFMVRYYMPLVGRMGSMLSCALLFGARFVYYGTYFAEFSPYLALVTEAFHGLAYGMIYTLVCDCASDCVEQLGRYLPELKSRGLIDPSLDENQLKLPLRATMQGVFSGAFDGLGYGMGALFGGVFLQLIPVYYSLWRVSAGISGLTFVYILATYRTAQKSVN